MGKIVVTEFVSLDGVIEDPGGSEDFKYSGWTFEIDRGDDGNQFKLDEALKSDALLLGRVTYQGFADAWPSRDGEFADKFNSMPKYVVSSTLKNPEWSNSTVLNGDLVADIAKVKEAHDGDIVVHGSAQLVQGLLEHDLVDEVRLMVFPRGARDRQAPVRQHERQEAASPGRVQNSRGRSRHPHLRARAITGYEGRVTQAVLDHASAGARLVSSSGWHITRDGQDVYPWSVKWKVSVLGRLGKLARKVDLDDQVEACRRIFTSETLWTAVRGNSALVCSWASPVYPGSASTRATM